MSEADYNTCPHCGKRYVVETHPAVCAPSSYQDTDTCPMCGEEFSGYLDHLKTCDGAAD